MIEPRSTDRRLRVEHLRVADDEVVHLKGNRHVIVDAKRRRSLAFVHAHGRLVLELRNTNSLESLEVYGEELHLAVERRLPNLEDLTVEAEQWNQSALRQFPELRRLELRHAQRVTAIDRLSKLEELRMPGLTAEAPFERWRGLPRLQWLDLSGCNVARLDGLERCARLMRIAAERSKIGDLSALAKTNVRGIALDYAEVPDLTPLRHHGLKDISLHCACMDPELIPDELVGALRPKKLQRRLARKRSVVRPARRYGAVGKQVARLKKFLVSRDLDKIDYGLELLESLNDAEIYEALLEGIAINILPPPVDEYEWCEPFLPNTIFDSGKVVRTFRQHAMRMLIAGAPERTHGASLRDQVKELEVSGYSCLETHPVDLSRLSRFSNLCKLEVVGASEVRNPAEIAKLDLQHFRASLDTYARPGPVLAFGHCAEVELVGPMSGYGRPAPALWDPVGEGAGWSTVTRASFSRVTFGNPRALINLSSLRSLKLRKVPGISVHVLSRIPNLELLQANPAELDGDIGQLPTRIQMIPHNR